MNGAIMIFSELPEEIQLEQNINKFIFKLPKRIIIKLSFSKILIYFRCLCVLHNSGLMKSNFLCVIFKIGIQTNVKVPTYNLIF